MADIDNIIRNIESLHNSEIINIFNGRPAFDLANQIFNLEDVATTKKIINNSALIIYKYTPRIHPKIIVKYIIGDSVIGTNYKKNVPNFLEQFI